MRNRSLYFKDFIGQADIVVRLRAFIELFAARGATPGPILLIGADGMGKATLATTVANERDVGFQELDAATIHCLPVLNPLPMTVYLLLLPYRSHLA